MALSLLEKYGFIEVASRIILNNCPKLKKMAKKLRANSNKASEAPETTEINPNLAKDYFASWAFPQWRSLWRRPLLPLRLPW